YLQDVAFYKHQYCYMGFTYYFGEQWKVDNSAVRYIGKVYLGSNSLEDLAEKYLSTYCKKTDTAKQLVQYWMPIVAASQSVKKIPEEQELLMKWANVADYQ
ncbi:MAG: hypothetical protein J1E41_03455, partial [Ruminococcus sp.]|nr:hypothetical protein [Ruminococcus sp.]